MARLNREFPPDQVAVSTLVANAPHRRAAAAFGPRAALLLAVLLAAGIAHLAADGAASARAVAADPELARLLRAMALIKGSMALAALWLADRLLRQPLGTALAAGLVLAVSLMAAAPVLMWHVAPVVAGALLFHAGLVLLLVLGWRPAESLLTLQSRDRRR